jgi:hypothetical protein
VCRWLDQGIDEAALELDARLILDAAAHATTIWPDDIDLPEETDQAGRASGSGFWSASGGGGSASANHQQ